MGTIQEDPNDPNVLIINGTIRVPAKRMQFPLFQKGLAEAIRDEAFKQFRESGYQAALPDKRHG